MLTLLTALALACSPMEDADPILLPPLRAAPGAYVEPGTTGELLVEGRPVAYTLATLDDASGVPFGGAWVFEEPLPEGALWSWQIGGAIAAGGEVLAYVDPAPFQILGVRHGDFLKNGDPCGPTESRRRLEVEVNVGEGPLWIRDADNGATLFQGFGQRDLWMSIEGRRRRPICLEGEWLRLDGTVEGSDVVCTGGCASAGGRALAWAWLLGLGLRARRR